MIAVTGYCAREGRYRLSVCPRSYRTARQLRASVSCSSTCGSGAFSAGVMFPQVQVFKLIHELSEWIVKHASS